MMKGYELKHQVNSRVSLIKKVRQGSFGNGGRIQRKVFLYAYGGGGVYRGKFFCTYAYNL